MRALFTVALLVAVAAVVLPAVETAGLDRAESQTQGEIARLVDAARTLSAGNDALASPDAAARTTLSLSLPDGGFASAPLASLTLGPPASTDRASERHDDPNGGPAATRITWRVEGGQRHTEQVDGLRLRPREGERYRLRRGGRTRLALRLVSRGGARVVTVSELRTR